MCGASHVRAMWLELRSCSTRRPCCRTELPRDTGHLHRKLAPTPWATQWIERTQQQSWNIRKLSKTLCKCISEGWCMSQDTRSKVHEIQGWSFDWSYP